MRRQLAALLVVALVAVAGCAGAGGPAADGSDASSGEPLHETPLDAESVGDAHVDALADAGTYTIESNATQESSARNGTVETGGVVRGDVASGAVFSRTDTAQRTVELYADGDGTAYQRFVAGERTQYRDATGQAGNATQYARDTVTSFVDLFDFSYAGTEDVDGQSVHVYEADGAASVNTSSPAFAQLNQSNVDEASATMHVDGDGVVRLAGYDITVTVRDRTQSIETTQRFTELGSTEVAEPDWLSEAASNAIAG
jgi:hypothetical protein